MKTIENGMSMANRIKNKKILLGFLRAALSLMLVLLFISGAVFTVLAFRPLYYYDVDHLNIEKTSGLSKERILENYDALIDYNLPLEDGELVFPSLNMSEHGKQHFAEVKDLFDLFKILFLVLLPLCIVGIAFFAFIKERLYLLITAIMSAALPAIVGALAAISWDTLFVKFHELFFDNRYWVFDPRYDPVITILPDTFFLHCAVGIALIVLFCGSVCAGIYIGGRSKEKRRRGFDLADDTTKQ